VELFGQAWNVSIDCLTPLIPLVIVSIGTSISADQRETGDLKWSTDGAVGGNSGTRLKVRKRPMKSTKTLEKILDLTPEEEAARNLVKGFFLTIKDVYGDTVRIPRLQAIFFEEALQFNPRKGKPVTSNNY
jgi:hypothetical protein